MSVSSSCLVKIELTDFADLSEPSAVADGLTLIWQIRFIIFNRPLPQTVLTRQLEAGN